MTSHRFVIQQQYLTSKKRYLNCLAQYDPLTNLQRAFVNRWRQLLQLT